MYKLLIFSFLYLLTFSLSFVRSQNGNERQVKISCGTPAITPKASNNRIVGGVPAIPHSWPWQISLRKRNSSNHFNHVCGGSILNQMTILTAAHCIGSSNALPSDFFIVAGDHDQTTDTDGIIQLRDIAWFRVHESYDASKGPPPNDIAIIVLKTPLQFNDNISPICLPENNIVSNQDCYSTGWGDTEGTDVKTVLNQARLPIINLLTCRSLPGYSQVLDSIICAGYLEGRVDTCVGDAGSPFVCKNVDGKWYLDGIVSWGIGCADPNKPGIYTRTFCYVNWITQALALVGCNCGIPANTPIRSSARIVGGIPAKPHSWPWQISLQKKNAFNQFYHICGGSILNEITILTAAHCFMSNSAISSDFLVVAGDYDQTTDTDGITQNREIAWFRVHESYDASKGPAPNDIAIIVLKTPFQFNDNISPICLPTTNIVSNQDCYSTGWGETEGTGIKTKLNQVRLPILNLSTCRSLPGYSLVLDSMICAGSLQGKVDTCKGDAGGPFMCKNTDGKWYLDGIVAWGIGCADENNPGIYTRTFSYLSWIRQFIGRDLCINNNPITTTQTTRSTTTTTTTTRPTTTTTTTTTISTRTTTTRITTTTSTTISRSRCGIPAITPIASNLKVVGGVPARPHSWPWQISLRKKYDSNQNYHNCGGSILNESIILTAAHCFGSNSALISDYFIVAGDHDQTTNTDGITQLREIAWFRVHQSYDASKGPAPNDIAIIVLKTPLQFNDNISPICLPKTNIVSNQDCYSTGWGETEGTAVQTTLNQARLPIINLQTCKSLPGYSLVLDSMICAGYLGGGVDTCQGDSGGPFVCKNTDGKWYLDGIVVWGLGCADPNNPGIYTRTFSFLNWVRQTTGFTG